MLKRLHRKMKTIGYDHFDESRNELHFCTLTACSGSQCRWSCLFRRKVKKYVYQTLQHLKVLKLTNTFGADVWSLLQDLTNLVNVIILSLKIAVEIDKHASALQFALSCFHYVMVNLKGLCRTFGLTPLVA